MSSTAAPSPRTFVPVVGITSFVAGILFILAGVGTYVMVSGQLADQHITVSEDASLLAGRTVAGPFTAYAQADVINVHALASTDGRTYSELGELIGQAEEGSAEEAELQAQRATVMNASFLRASLYTSVVAFGVAVLVIGIGVVLALSGLAIRRLALMNDARAAQAQDLAARQLA
ncbi:MULTISPECIES: aromatic ring-opening dioxygenase LigA [unclassified Pseudactinotalea]|uniref:aromatic ring-opening dioxygenase LigA n=1 Tax=unclassified Pseudactinotalea TaxID=2649176 RepID=UPI00128CEC92|nr:MULTISPECIES: aromatic ring-opening dioxygenase LigA [unclassified Pseudactinotalea]MPV50355.1 aromatic ring-opening dioxygenase LigA [Pseudactinotalea sp. HY160]QGH68952.1 aromatic ring-opening dioxygenase LigA [Pseudactinotalea sp. HY158]